MIGRIFQALALAVLLWPTVGHSATIGDSIIRREKYCTPESGYNKEPPEYGIRHTYCIATCLANETAISGWARRYSRSKRAVTGGHSLETHLRGTDGGYSSGFVPVGRWWVYEWGPDVGYDDTGRETHVAILCIPTGPHKW